MIWHRCLATRKTTAERAFAQGIQFFHRLIGRETVPLDDLRPGLDMRAVTLTGEPVTFLVTDMMLSSSLSRPDTAREVEVQGLAIAEVLQTHRPTVLVLDVAGAETTLLPGASLDGVRALLVETHANVTGHAAVDEMIAALERQGFRVARRAHRNLVFER